MKKPIIAASLLTVFSLAGAHAQSAVGDSVPVTVNNFARAESDHYFATNAKEAGHAISLSDIRRRCCNRFSKPLRVKSTTPVFQAN